MSKLGGRNIKEYLQPRNTGLREVVIRGTEAGSRLNLSLGKADDIVEETGLAGEIRPDEGEMSLDGRPVSHPSPRAARDRGTLSRSGAAASRPVSEAPSAGNRFRSVAMIDV
jgi:hypothetical protein